MKIQEWVKKQKFASLVKLKLSYQAGKRSREEKSSVNIWELDSDNIHVTEMLKETFLMSPIATKCQIGIPSIHI